VPIGNQAGIAVGTARGAATVARTGLMSWRGSEAGEGTATAETPVFSMASKAEVATRIREMEYFNSGAIVERKGRR